MLKDGDRGVIIQRDKKTYAVAPHIPCGVVTSEILRKIADVADKYDAAALKITSASRIAIVGLNEEDIDDVWARLDMAVGAAVGLCVRSIKACPGTTFCKRGMQDSLGLGLEFDRKYHGMQLPGKFKMGISGCPNQCAETCIKDIGLVGMPNGWKILVGGNGGAKPRLSQELAKDLTTDQVRRLADKIIDYYKANARARQRLGAMIEKMGFDEFKSAVLSD
jgi:NAD(P)H-nitrite reductase large subunit